MRCWWLEECEDCEGRLPGVRSVTNVTDDCSSGGSVQEEYPPSKGESEPAFVIPYGAPQVLLAPYLLYQCEGVQRGGVAPDEFPDVEVLIRIRVMCGFWIGQAALV